MWATPADIRARWPGAPADDALIATWLSDAETTVRAEYPWLDEWLSADADLLAIARTVLIRMVVRALSTPPGVRQEGVGDANVVYTDSAGLYLTDADRALLDGHGPQSAFTISQIPDRNLPSDWRWWWARGWDDEADFWRWVS